MFDETRIQRVRSDEIRQNSPDIVQQHDNTAHNGGLVAPEAPPDHDPLGCGKAGLGGS
jgi:hypothetical protein